jgi:hypothetical protein
MATDLIATVVPVVVRLVGVILVIGACYVVLTGLRDVLCLLIQGDDYWKKPG